MEIDFLGLSSKHSTRQKEKENSNDSFTDSGEEIYLSLSTSSSLDFQKDILDFPENTWKFHGEKRRPECRSSSNNTFSTCFSHSLEHAPLSEPTFVASLRPFFYPSSTTSTLYHLNDRYDNVTNDTITEQERGYAPTVSMARKASLARFLEKRSHRLTQAGKSFFMGELLDDINSKASIKKMKHGGRP